MIIAKKSITMPRPHISSTPIADLLDFSGRLPPASSVFPSTIFPKKAFSRSPKPSEYSSHKLASDSIEHAEKHTFHMRLGRFNARRLLPALPREDWRDTIRTDATTLLEEGAFVERERARIQPIAAAAPTESNAFARWFEELRESGPGQGDAFFSWLAGRADLSQMRWFLTQEVAGEAGFEDLVALSQIRLPNRPKLEMARNYWDELGRGHERGMHGPMLARIVRELALDPQPVTTAWESLALANLMVALAANRRYAYHAIGALGVIEMTAPGRASLVEAGLKRLGVPKEARMYFSVHATLDVKHSEAWNREVLIPLIEADAAAATAIAEGALMRLASGARCFKRYRAQFGLSA